ncbi:hypothetical protein LWI28_028949 [Acer negundo]|uniref:Uncharacterized protein n=1 Tax=Acer negundo TaxID=4023 RepID=A0AAD5P4J2_ACENE|nr:hypothetical protein LWI28_028949 [Acer negundo]
MENFNKGMASFTSRASRVTESQVMQATYEKLLNRFMEASQDRFSKLEKAVNIIDGHLVRIADKLLSGKIGSSRDLLNLGSARAILRSGRIVDNGRNEEIVGEINNSPRERKDKEKWIPVQEDIEGGRIQIPDELETLNANPSNNKLPNPGVPKRADKWERDDDNQVTSRGSLDQLRQSYANIVKPDKDKVGERRTKQMEIPISMSWIGSEEDIFWLSRSVVRWPKQFSSIESVNRKLDSRGFNYSSSYLGGKGVVWTFESECGRDGFFNNEFF